MSIPSPLQQAVEHLRAGRVDSARQLLASYLRSNPRSDAGWYLLSFTLDNPAQQREALQRALRINPTNDRARARLTKMAGDDRPAPAPPPAEQPALERRAPMAPLPRRRPAGPTLGFWGGLTPRNRRWVVLGTIAFLLAGLAGGIYFFTTLTRDLGSQRVAAVTAQAATAAWRATTGASVGLPPTWTPEPSPTLPPTATITAIPSETPTSTPVPPSAETAAEMETIKQEVADLRGLARQDTASSYLITGARVRPILEASFRAGGGSLEEVADQSRVLVALGLIKPTYDLYTNILNGLTDSLGGFYLPWSHEIFVIGSRFTGVERWVYSHEYGHALVDSHYEIGSAGVYPLCLRTTDQCNAIQALVEGDATLVMTQWWQQYAGPQDYEDIFAYTPPHRTLPDQFPPPYSLPDSSFPYEQGAAFVEYLYNRGNWAEVNSAYQRLPESSEQILHPAKYVADEGPVSVAAADLGSRLGGDWRMLAQDTLGEWTTFLILAYGADLSSQLDIAQAEAAAAGWGGDTYLVFYNDSTEQTVLAARWLWETQSDADQFSAGLQTVLDGRHRGNGVNLGRGQCWQATGEVSCMLGAGREILWLFGPDGDLVPQLFGAFPGFR